jgi:hypothetical protein
MSDNKSILPNTSKPLELLSLLLDNSTYFSFKHLTLEAKIDANSIYNAANFLESVVLSDSITMAPTIAWHPDSSDVLFKDGSICTQYPIDSLPDIQLVSLFQEAVKASLRDLHNQQIKNDLRVTDEMFAATQNTLLGWQNEIIDNP